MTSTPHCGFCGRYRGPTEEPHPDSDSCPHAKAHADPNPDNTLREAIQATCAGDSVCLLGWNPAYPAFKTVYNTRTWLETQNMETESNDGHKKYDTAYFKKTIWATSNPHNIDDTHHRIEYDPTTQSLIDWYTVTDEAKEHGAAPFKTYIRRDDPDVSFFGASR
jgi:hypothetical protein